MVPQHFLRLSCFVPCLVAVWFTLALRAPGGELRFTIEDTNDDEFAAAPPPAPVNEVEHSFQVTRSGQEQVIPILSSNLRNLSIKIENRGRGLVRAPYLFGPQGWDFRSLERVAAEVTKSPGLSTTEKFIRIHEWKGLHVMNVLGGSYAPYNDDNFSGNPLRVLNQYGHAMCGQSTNTTNALLMAVPPVGSMFGRKVKLNAHRVGEAFFDGRWHAFDTTPGTGIIQWIYYDSDNMEIASTWKDLIRRPELLSRIRSWSGFSLDRYTDLKTATGETLDVGKQFRGWDFNFDLRPGESITLFFDMRGRLDRTSARQDNSQSYRCYSDYGSAVFNYRPDLTSNQFARHAAQMNNVKATEGGLVPIDPTRPSSVVFPLRSVWCFVGSEIWARFKTSGKVSIAVNRDPFETRLPAKPPWQLLSSSRREYGESSIEGLMAYWVQCEFQGAGSGLSEIEIASEVQMSPWSMPGLQFGVNRVRLEAEDFDGSALEVTYRYDDRSPFHFYELPTSRYGRHIPLRIGGVLQQGSKKGQLDWRKGRFWERLHQSPEARVPVRLEIYQVSSQSEVGRRVRTLVDKPLHYGFYKFYWDGRDDSGRLLPVGMYAYKAAFAGEVVHGERIYLYSEIWPRPNELNDPQSLVIVEPARLFPRKPLVFEWARFSVVARSAPGETLLYAWDFGDGILGTGQSLVHAYSRPGTYKVVATVTDSKGSKRSEVTVEVLHGDSTRYGWTEPRMELGYQDLQPPAPEPGAPLNLNNVGGGGEEEEKDGGVAAVVAQAAAGLPGRANLLISSFSGKVRYEGARRRNGRGPDVCVVEGVLHEIPAGWHPQGKMVIVDVGGVEASFTLDGRGRARTNLGSLRLRLPRRHGEFAGGAVAFRLRLKGDLANEWVDEGVLGDSDESGSTVRLRVEIVIDQQRFTADLNTLLQVEAGRFARLRA